MPNQQGCQASNWERLVACREHRERLIRHGGIFEFRGEREQQRSQHSGLDVWLGVRIRRSRRIQRELRVVGQKHGRNVDAHKIIPPALAVGVGPVELQQPANVDYRPAGDRPGSVFWRVPPG